MVAAATTLGKGWAEPLEGEGVVEEVVGDAGVASVASKDTEFSMAWSAVSQSPA